ncbi:MAG TPA: mechanosensitive ion channel family protein [Saprospiraceae bacterium]|nr:mechanosensitive ion channel family protein [Saprospiraceae bacterium]HMP13414.1 mechanosensitive ion channel family protein [Saprospiraceae bacterium]
MDFFLKENIQQIALFSAIVLITFLVAWLFRRAFRRFILESSLIIKNDPTRYQFLKHFIVAIIYIIGFSQAVYIVPSLRTLANSLLAGAGILAVAVGFASQQALGNIVSGVFIVLFRPFRVNDRLSLRDSKLNGVVEDINLRHTIIRDFNNRRIIIPNSIMSQEVIVNADLNDDRICRWVEMGISYDSNIDLAREIMLEEAKQHPLRIDGRTPEQIAKGKSDVFVRVIALGDFAVTLRLYVWAKDNPDAFAMGCDLLESIKKRFDEAGIEIPFPYRTIVFKEKNAAMPVDKTQNNN